MAQVRKLLNSIGQELTKENITALKHECADVIPAGRAEEISTPFQLYEELIRMDKLGDDNLEYLGERLRSIGRQDLKDKLLETSVSTTVQRNLVTQEIITSIAEEISIDWKDVGRRLKLKESILDNIEDENRKTKEKSTQMLNKWKQLNAASATIQVLMVALKQAGRRDIAETLEEMTQVHASEQDDVRTATTALEKLELSDGFSDRGKPLTTPEK
ncbi:FAS-associated death domain protein-like isoform X2 [Nematostella vectensis]|uniref:FAS-associated death domain protein-like isoform X2 n=1 Tax=Nematostella vectensis TaxID=45351 RepID=UPI002076F783|nr:FAS-associated death domain protein-like isoform X2 [Nematostella vectensis]